MTRVKKGVNALKSRHGRSTKERQANEAIFHAGTYAFAHRKDRKGDFRRLWIVRLSALLKQNGLLYSKFISLLKTKNVALDRKILAHLADKHPETFKEIIKTVSK